MIHTEASRCKRYVGTGVTVCQAGQRTTVGEVPEVMVETAASSFHSGPFPLAATYCAQVGLIVTARGPASNGIDADVGGDGLTARGEEIHMRK